MSDERDEQRHKKWWDWRVDAGQAGGCCLLELFAAATCLAGIALIPLLVR
ncbi:MAG TPA: hypothetical protein VEZ41_16475 [Allosphingosinicella sp.]|jgi:hypothetical protein|nr:hypothetical protein [Allosphingosinicella sp.]